MGDLGRRFVECFARAVDDAGLPDHAEFRAVLHAYMQWAVGEVLSYSPAVRWFRRAWPCRLGRGTAFNWNDSYLS
jgi:hypothetical protein